MAIFILRYSHHPDIENYIATSKKGLLNWPKTNIPLTATQDIHYLKPEDAMAQDILVVPFKPTPKWYDANRLTMKLGDFSMKSGEEMEKLFKDTPDAVENTFKIAEMCDVKLSLGKWVFPKLELEGNKKPEEYLTESARQNYLKIFGNDDAGGEVKKTGIRAGNYQLQGLRSLLLDSGDLINFARSQK